APFQKNKFAQNLTHFEKNNKMTFRAMFRTNLIFSVLTYLMYAPFQKNKFAQNLTHFEKNT
ncbi:MAG: hypothetical protein RR872_00530, partial [Mucinivorans sp.]